MQQLKQHPMIVRINGMDACMYVAIDGYRCMNVCNLYIDQRVRMRTPPSELQIAACCSEGAAVIFFYIILHTMQYMIDSPAYYPTTDNIIYMLLLLLLLVRSTIEWERGRRQQLHSILYIHSMSIGWAAYYAQVGIGRCRHAT